MTEQIMTLFLIPVLLFLAGMVCMRLLGKKVLAEMTGLEIFAVFTIIDMSIGPLIQKSWVKTLYFEGLFMCLYLLSSKIKNKKWLHHLLSPPPTLLIKNGKIEENGLKKTKLTVDELMALLRIKGYFSPADVEMATMEAIGQVSILAKSNQRPVEPSDLGLAPPPAFSSIPLIINGEVQETNLKFLNLDPNWLHHELMTQGLDSHQSETIRLAEYTQDGSLKISQKRLNQEGTTPST